MAEYAIRKVIFLAVIAFAAFVGMAFAATYTAHADHDPTDPDHPFRTEIDEQLKRNLGGSTCHFINVGGDEFLANGHNVPVRFCPWTAHADDIAESRHHDALGNVALVMGSRSFFALPDADDVRLTPSGHAAFAGIPESAASFGDLKIARLVQCANTPVVIYQGELWHNGSVWCQGLSGFPFTASFHTD